MNYERIKRDYENISNRISSLEEELRNLPPGKLICSHQQHHVKWYNSIDHQKIYIPKTNQTLAEQLARKKYILLLLGGLKKEKHDLALYLQHHSLLDKANTLLDDSDGYRKLLAPYLKPTDKELIEWMTQPYNKCPLYPENLIHKGVSNHLLRSKSEVLIDMMLCHYQIPFRYECELTLDNIIIYPDFTIRHPKTGEYFYWEHFGLMDVQSYINKTSSKINLYASNGITPGIRLITTFETQKEPLNPETVEMYIKHFFT